MTTHYQNYSTKNKAWETKNKALECVERGIDPAISYPWDTHCLLCDTPERLGGGSGDGALIFSYNL